VSWFVDHSMLVSPLISALACIATLAAWAQQLPQVPWSELFAVIADSVPHEKSLGKPLPCFLWRLRFSR